jgi:hypothetical protein
LETEADEWCGHAADERSLNGTWGIPELLLAIEHGYRFL